MAHQLIARRLGTASLFFMIEIITVLNIPFALRRVVLTNREGKNHKALLIIYYYCYFGRSIISHFRNVEQRKMNE